MTNELYADQLLTLTKLRAEFPSNQISSLPKPTRKQTEDAKANRQLGIFCKICNQWHHSKAIHLSYVGHAALTSRLLDVDPLWNWEPLALDDVGLPALDRESGLWIKLTVGGMTRIGYGDAPGKIGGDAMKERIGDALRNAGIRFGCALDLWHKGDLYAHEEAESSPELEAKPEPKKQPISDERLNKAIERINGGEYTLAKLVGMFELTDTQVEKLEASIT
jgi:hypothetical protein